MKFIIILLCSLALTSCAFTPMTVELELDTSVLASNIGNGQTVHLWVVDERTEQQIGNRGGASFKGAKITLDEDLAGAVQSTLSEMLQTKGFNIAYDESNSQKPSLRVDIHGLTYSMSSGFYMLGSWTGEVQVTTALKATVNNELENYNNFYRYDNKVRVNNVVPGADSNNERINIALNDVLHQLVSDHKLLEALAQR